jgi:carboxymethylenebutenolidase
MRLANLVVIGLAMIVSLGAAACSTGAPASDRATGPSVASGTFAATPVATSTPMVTAAAPTATAPPTTTAVPPTAMPTLGAASGATWSATTTPVGATVGGGTWIRIPAPAGKAILAEVFRPAGQGPWPAVVFLHGSSGFANIHLRIGSELAGSGFLAIVGCWFAGSYGTAVADPPPTIANPDAVLCPEGPVIKPLGSTAQVDDIAVMIAAARTMQDVNGRVGLVGYSRGSLATLLAASAAAGSMQAVGILGGSAPISPTGGPLTQAITAPVLILQGDADEVLPVQNSRNLEAALRTLGKSVQMHLFPGAGHGFLFEQQWHADALGRLVAFLKSTLAS